MELEYQTEIDALNPSFDGYGEVDSKIAFRWTFNDIDHPLNFQPVTKTNPTYKKPFGVFTGWALSFFESQKQGVDKLKYLVGDKSQLYKKFGTHIAEGLLEKHLGLCELKCDEDGHFNFFGYKGVDFRPHFKVFASPVEEM